MCNRLGIEHRLAPVCYPQTNGQVEVMNRTIFQGIKKNLLDSKARWYEEFPRMLWSYRTTPSNATRETPFSLVFGTEAILPVEVCLPNIRQICFDEEKNEEWLKKDKLNPKWEGPYKVGRVIGPGTYELEELSGKAIKHTWHEIYLKKYYV
ncbi:hypothetical protein LIER_37544 [Lithospermum erythrorhizon]|uniref:Integrase catalytic domain-containing protein n=1 Tax=Lithospermum erythrorhizon TaxID=34254 RepID=A0AAV3PLX2_LITER